MEKLKNEDLPQKIMEPRPGTSQTQEIDMHPVAKMENNLKKKKAVCEQTRQELYQLKSSILTKQALADNTEQHTRMIEKNTAECRNLARMICTIFESTSKEFLEFEANTNELEAKVEPLYYYMVQKNKRNDKRVEELTQFINQLIDEFQVKQDTVRAENEKLLKDTEARKIEFKMLCDQEANEEDIDNDDEKQANEIINLENKLKDDDRVLMNNKEKFQQFADIEAEKKESFAKTISELQGREKEINSDLPQTEQQLDNVKGILTAKNMALQKLMQKDKQLDDDIDYRLRSLENDEYSKLQLEIERIRAENAEKIELRNAAIEKFAKITKSVEDEDRKIKNTILKIEKLTMELNAVKDQIYLLNIKDSETTAQYDELYKLKATLAENKAALQKKYSETEVAILKANEEINDETEEKKLKILSLEETNLQEIQENEKKLTLLMEKLTNLHNKEAQIKLQLEEEHQKVNVKKQKITLINTTKKEIEEKMKNLETTYTAKLEEKNLIKKKLIGHFLAPPPIFVQPTALAKFSKPKIPATVPEIPKPHVPAKKKLIGLNLGSSSIIVPPTTSVTSDVPVEKKRKLATNWDSDATVTDEEPENDLLAQLLKKALDFERSPAVQTLPDIIENDENVSGNYSQKTLHIDANSSEPQNEIPHPLPNTDTTEQHQEPTKENAEEPGSYVPKPGCSAEKPSSEYSVSYDDERPTILRLTKRNYYVSPLHSDESDIDDSDADPNFTVDNSPEAGRSSHDTDKENIQSDESVSAEPDNTNKGKKRKLNAQEWGVKKTKLLRNSGKAYTSCSKSKKKFPERKLRLVRKNVD